MNKRIIGVLLCIGILFAAAVPVFAQETAQLTISTAEEFLSFAENCRLDSYSQGLTVSLQADIDLSGREFSGIPIFSGTFDGNDHKISGLSIQVNGSAQGLFRYLTQSAVVRNLHAAGEIVPQGSRDTVGGIAGSNAGLVENCSFSGTVSGGSSVGGLVGINTVTGILDNCRAEGVVHGNHFVGGIVGENLGVIRNCGNTTAVNTTARQNSVDISDITLGTLTGTESAGTVTDIGGIAGTSSGTIRDCENRGSVGYRHMGYNIGGIAGSQTGYITGCENYGEISGRKEVGGIAGQIEPSILLRYETDTLQLLQAEMAILSDLTDRAVLNAQNNTGNIRSLLAALESHIQNAENAIDQLIADPENPEQPDPDSILAAFQTVSSSITGISETLRSLSLALENTTEDLDRDLQAIADQAAVIDGILSNASDNLGGSVTDISDQDTPEDLTSKISSCTNFGAVLADLNAGGIVGAIALENDLDPEADVQISGSSSLNAAGRIRSVVLDCVNSAEVTVKKQNAGGIVGWQSLGLVKGCLNTGSLEAEAADYVGGIAGRSSGFIRSSSAKCVLSGDAYVGGIAGSAAVVSDCRSMTRIRGSEKLGALIGFPEESYIEEENPIRSNFYLPAPEDIGAIDGISYAGCAEPLDTDAFLSLENLPQMFRTVTVTFLFEDGTRQTVTIASGGDLKEADIPALPEQPGSTGLWEGLADADLSAIHFDTTFQAVYTAHNTTIQSEAVREDGRPILLVQGSFTGGATVTASISDTLPTLKARQQLVESWNFAVSENADTARFLLPADHQTEGLTLLIRNADGSWSEVEYTVDGSYIVFRLSSGASGFAIVETAQPVWPWIAAAAGAAAILAAVLVIAARFRKKSAKKDAAPESEEAHSG